MSGFYTISLSKFDKIDADIMREAIHYHLDRVEIIDDKNASDYSFSSDMIPPAPYKIGEIIDILESNIFKNRFQNKLNFNNYSLDWSQSQLVIGDDLYSLTDRERDLMAELIIAGADGCPRDHLLGKIWGYRADLDTHALETQIYRLRQKIEKIPDNPQRLMTVDNGYRLN